MYRNMNRKEFTPQIIDFVIDAIIAFIGMILVLTIINIYL